MVSRGILTFEMEDEGYEVAQGDAVHVFAEKERCYENRGTEPLVINVTSAWGISSKRW